MAAPKLGAMQLRIMRVLWRRGEAAAGAITEDLRKEMRVALLLTAALLLGTACLDAQVAKADEERLGFVRIESTPPGAEVFVRTGGPNGFVKIGTTPISLARLQPGLFEYTLLRIDRQIHDGSLWIEPGGRHVENVTLKTGRVFFVDQGNPGAQDSNPGTEDSPWKTMGRACEILVAGDAVLVKEGAYYEDSRWQRKRSWPPIPGIAPRNSGEPGRPIVLRAYPGHRVHAMSGPSLTCDPRPVEAISSRESREKLPAGEMPRFGDFTNPAIGADRVSWIVIDGFKVYGSIQIEDSSHCLVQNCEVWQGFGNSLPHVHDNNDLVWLEGAGQTVVRNNLLRDNRYHHTGNCTGVKLYRCTQPERGECIVENNEVRAMALAFLDKARGAWRNTFRRNLVRDVSAGLSGYLGGGPAEGDLFYQNVLHANPPPSICQLGGQRFQIFNNTLVWGRARGPDDASIVLRGADRLRIYNNLLESVHTWDRGALGGMEVSDSNGFIGRGRFWIEWHLVGALSAWRKDTGFEQNSLEIDPMFVDEAAGDFHLAPGSPCIDRGQPVTRAIGEGRDRDTITVEAAFSFTDGEGVIGGDSVQIGRGADAQRANVVDVVDGTHLKLDRKVSWTDGDWVTFPFEGAAPDLGAYESGDERQIIGPTWRIYPKRDFSRRE